MEGGSSHLEEALATKFTSGLLENISRVKECEEKVRQLRNYHYKLKGNTEQLRDQIGRHGTDVESSLAGMRAKFTALEEDMGKLLAS